MSRHGWFIFFAYGVTAISVTGLVAWIIFEYRRLRSALAKFPPRESDEA